MPFLNQNNHRAVWFDVISGARNASWWQVFHVIYHKSFTHSNYRKCLNRNHEQVRSEVYKDERIKKYIENDPKVDQVIENVLNEMCHLLERSNPSRRIKFAGTPLFKCITKIYSHVYVNSHMLPDINKSQDSRKPSFISEYLSITKDAPVIILPTHKSYMDFLLISYIMFDSQTPLPIVATGDNFKAMGSIMTDYLKSTGGFLVRRNSQNQKDVPASVYYDILRAYVHSIIIGGEHPLEFFMEGTRTRTGQVLKPKTGLLSMVVDFYIKNNVDVYILPVSCCYQRPIEEQLYIAETDPQTGMKKPKESKRNLIAGFSTIINNKYGNVYVRFITPFKISQYYEAWKLRNRDLVESDSKDAIVHKLTSNLASKVCLDQAYNTVLTPFFLISSAALCMTFLNVDADEKQKRQQTNLFLGESGEENGDETCTLYKLAMSEVMSDFSDIESFIVATQPQFTPGWESISDVFEEFEINRRDVVRASKDRKFMEFEQSSNVFFTFLYYSNQVMQMLLPCSICLLSSNENSDVDLMQYKTVRKLLSYEFLMDDSDLDKEICAASKAIRKLREMQEKALQIKRAKKIIMQLLKYYVDGYLTFLSYIQDEFKHFTERLPVVFNKSKFFATIKDSNEFISKDMLKNMMLMATEFGACDFEISRENDIVLSYSLDQLKYIKSQFTTVKLAIERRILCYSK